MGKNSNSFNLIEKALGVAVLVCWIDNVGSGGEMAAFI